MKKPHALVIAGAILLAVTLFPPADFIFPATYGMIIGDSKMPDTPQRAVDRGFVFITEVGGQVSIRMAQWLTELGVAAVIGAGLVATSKPKLSSQP